MYQTIGSKTEAPRAVGYKRGRLQEDGGPTSRQKKARVTYEELDFETNLSKWKKPELEAYLSHHKIAKSCREQTCRNSLGVSPITYTLLQLSNNELVLTGCTACMRYEQLHGIFGLGSRL